MKKLIIFFLALIFLCGFRMEKPPIFTNFDESATSKLNNVLEEIWNILNGRFDRTEKLKIGDTTNYAEIKNNGAITLHGTARYNIGFEIDSSGFKEPPAQAASLVNRGNGVAWEFTDGDELHLHAEIRLTGRWVTTEELCVILLWDSPTTSEDCDWEVRYLFRAPNEDMTSEVMDGTVTDFLESSSTANGLVHSDELCVPCADFNKGDKILQIEVWRDGNDTGDTLGDSAFLHRMIVRGTANKLGGVTN